MIARMIRIWIAALALTAWSLADASVMRHVLIDPTHFVLDANHTLPGLAVDAVGQPLEGQTVDLNRHGLTVAKAVTAADGSFRLVIPVGTRMGMYQLSVGTKTVDCRIWNASNAPAAASKVVELTNSTTLVASGRSPIVIR